MKKIYITSLHLNHGGVEMAITLLANALVKRNYDVEILCIYNLGTPAYALDERVKVTYLTNVKPNKDEFKQACRSKNPFKILKEGLYSVKVLCLKKKSMKDAIISIDDGTVIATRIEHAVLLSKFGKKDVTKIAQLHHDHNFSKDICDNFINRYNNIDEFVVLTDLLKEEISEMMKDNKHTNIRVIPNFLSEYSKLENVSRKNKVVTVGRIHEVKGFERLIDIWALVKKDNDEVLEIIGDGDETIKSSLQNKITELGLEKSVVLKGALSHDEVLKEMLESKLYVMTSYSEAFPFVLLEAMSSGLPVVAFDVRVGPRAIITDGKDGFLIKDGDNRLFADKLYEMLSNDDMIDELSKNAIKKADMFSEEEVIKKWLEII